MTIKDLIDKAEAEWDMDRLKADLAIYKREYTKSKRMLELSDKEYECLGGFLCSYPPAEMAKMLNNKMGSLRQELSNGLYCYIQMLIEDKTGCSFKIQWFYIARQLDNLGYKKQPKVKSDWTLKINLEALSQEEQEDIIAKMKNVLSDYSISLEDIKKGSLILRFSSYQEAFEQAKALFEAGELSDLLGIPILDVQSVTTEPSKTPVEQETLANSLLRRCRREGYDWVELPQILEILDAVRLAYLTRKEAIKAALEELLFPDMLVGAAKSSGDDDSEDDYEEEELDTEFLNTVAEEVIRFYEI